MTHINNGIAGNIERHSTIDAGKIASNITADLKFEHYSFCKLQVINETTPTFTSVRGSGTVGDEVMLLKKSSTDITS
jgi:hypothetical protein